jgi:tRNA-specific 2-thiouridylase
MFPVGGMDKSDVRLRAAEIDLRTADKPDSQDVCFITSTGGRTSFLGDRIPFRPASVVDTAGRDVGRVEAVEMVTIGQRKGLGLAGGTDPRYVIDVDAGAGRVTVGERADLETAITPLESWTWTGRPVDGLVELQCSAHGPVAEGRVLDGRVEWSAPHRRIAPGQSVVAYRDDTVVGGGIATRVA